MRVVIDDPERLVLWMPQGAMVAKLGDGRGRPTRDLVEAAERIFVPSPCEQLHVIERGRAHSVQARWAGPERRFQGWYINLQEPVRPSPVGWDTHDQQLDLLIDPDGAVHWKDEDQFSAVTAAGWYTSAQVEAVWLEGQAALGRFLRGEGPFVESWETWSPDPSWTAPELAPGWDVVVPELELEVA
ncbi:MAG: DUF402 domain-containing protein [Actinomycetia bacterium]|nr:DUF402 domain-containing protein [Actinomycetes bacterium]MCP3909687.1 DUF402 domain-containing protein [Actinomycetes bacterium]MCP4083868.1 DUF402 domain-containing protein [Actinomycetes bacterium]